MNAGSFEKSRLELVGTLQGHSSFVTGVSYSSDGMKVASSGSWEKTVKLWDVSSGELLQTLEGHSNGVLSVSFSPDGTKVASGSADKTIKIWEDPRDREMKVTMLCLRRANRRRLDFGVELPSEAGRKLYNPDILRKLWEFL